MSDELKFGEHLRSARPAPLSISKQGGIYVAPCDFNGKLYPENLHPSKWRSCGDAYEYTWDSDFENDLVEVNEFDRLRLIKTMGFCPQNRCQLYNLSNANADGSCPGSLCYTKVENGGLSFGACCFIHGEFNFGGLIGFYNKTQKTPKPIYKSSRVVLGSEIGSNDVSYHSFINANVVHKGLIATQCPMLETTQDIKRMILEQNVSLWVQLAPFKYDEPKPVSACASLLHYFQPSRGDSSGISEVEQLLTPCTHCTNHSVVSFMFTLTGHTKQLSTNRWRTDFFEADKNNSAEFIDNSLQYHRPSGDSVSKQPYIDSMGVVEQRIRVKHIWYNKWRDFNTPIVTDDEVILDIASEIASVIGDGGTAVISCKSGRGRSGTLAALSLGILKQRQLIQQAAHEGFILKPQQTISSGTVPSYHSISRDMRETNNLMEDSTDTSTISSPTTSTARALREQHTGNIHGHRNKERHTYKNRFHSAQQVETLPNWKLTLTDLTDIIVNMREHRDGLVETPQQFRYVARLLGLVSRYPTDIHRNNNEFRTDPLLTQPLIDKISSEKDMIHNNDVFNSNMSIMLMLLSFSMLLMVAYYFIWRRKISGCFSQKKALSNSSFLTGKSSPPPVAYNRSSSSTPERGNYYNYDDGLSSQLLSPSTSYGSNLESFDTGNMGGNSTSCNTNTAVYNKSGVQLTKRLRTSVPEQRSISTSGCYGTINGAENYAITVSSPSKPDSHSSSPVNVNHTGNTVSTNHTCYNNTNNDSNGNTGGTAAASARLHDDTTTHHTITSTSTNNENLLDESTFPTVEFSSNNTNHHSPSKAVESRSDISIPFPLRSDELSSTGTTTKHLNTTAVLPRPSGESSISRLARTYSQRGSAFFNAGSHRDNANTSKSTAINENSNYEKHSKASSDKNATDKETV